MSHCQSHLPRVYLLSLLPLLLLFLQRRCDGAPRRTCSERPRATRTSSLHFMTLSPAETTRSASPKVTVIHLIDLIATAMNMFFLADCLTTYSRKNRFRDDRKHLSSSALSFHESSLKVVSWLRDASTLETLLTCIATEGVLTCRKGSLVKSCRKCL